MLRKLPFIRIIDSLSRPQSRHLSLTEQDSSDVVVFLEALEHSAGDSPHLCSKSTQCTHIQQHAYDKLLLTARHTIRVAGGPFGLVSGRGQGMAEEEQAREVHKRPRGS